jgi:hypothetical protein
VNDFINRIDAQREFLRVLNAVAWPVEPLHSLSDGAINRWISVNRLGSASDIAKLVVRAGDALAFLANKSQEQITEDYQSASENFSSLVAEAAIQVSRFSEMQ